MISAEYLALHPDRVTIMDPDEIVKLDPHEFRELARVYCEAARGERVYRDIKKYWYWELLDCGAELYEHWQDTPIEQSFLAVLDVTEFDYVRCFAFIIRMEGLMLLVKEGWLAQWIKIEAFNDWPDNWPSAVGEFCAKEFMQTLRRRVRHVADNAKQR